MFKLFASVSSAFLLMLPSLGHAGKVKVWHHHAPDQYEKAHFKHTVVSSEGAIRLSRQLKPLADVDATHVWAVAEDKAGNLFAATGDEGKLYRVTPEGKVSVAFTSTDSQILALTTAADGSLYAGTGPNGQIIRIDADGTVKVIHQLSGSYIWSLAVDRQGRNIYAATGPNGKIYRLTPEGDAKLFYSTKQDHILCLALAPDGMLYAGSDKAGLVYRIDPQGKAFVLFSAPQGEIRSLRATADGVYVGTSSPSQKRFHSSRSASSSFPSPSFTSSPSGLSDRVTKAEESDSREYTHVRGGSSSRLHAKESPRGDPASAPAAPSIGVKSLYRIAGDGSVREVFREKALVLSLLRENSRIFIGTGMDGRLFEVDPISRERSEIARLDHGQILCMCKRRDGSIVLGTGDPGKLYVLQNKYAPRGAVVSEVLDAKIISKWGALRWQADTPEGSAVTVSVRSGNVAEPDETWSDWSAEQTDSRRSAATAPAARFLQYRLTLTSQDANLTPTLRDLTLRFKNTNQAPEVTGLEAPNLDASNLDDPKRLKFRWTVADPNEDELSYSLYVKKDGWTQWVLLEEDYDRKDFEWDATTTPSGIYQFKVVASDRHDNAEGEAMTAERVSEPFIVSHTPPKVSLKVIGMEGEQAVLEASATDPFVRLTSASFAVNGRKWTNVFPDDGLFDDKTETFKFKTDTLKPGAYVVVLRVKDAAGNTGSEDVVFNVQRKER